MFIKFKSWQQTFVGFTLSTSIIYCQCVHYLNFILIHVEILIEDVSDTDIWNETAKTMNTNHLGVRNTAALMKSVFSLSGVCTVLCLRGGFSSNAEQVASEFCIQILMVLLMLLHHCNGYWGGSEHRLCNHKTITVFVKHLNSKYTSFTCPVSVIM